MRYKLRGGCDIRLMLDKADIGGGTLSLSVGAETQTTASTVVGLGLVLGWLIEVLLSSQRCQKS